MTFRITGQGKPFTPADFINWFRDCGKVAGLPTGLSAHGLRKAVCRRLAEAGCTPHEIMAISGHKTLSEVTRYTREAAKKGPQRRHLASGRGRAKNKPPTEIG
ncbi:MAG TPA: tyrosine-type recombinase/integrase [Devosiaceae bacterium]